MVVARYGLFGLYGQYIQVTQLSAKRKRSQDQNHLTPYIVGYSIVTGGDLMGTLFEDIQQGLQEAIDYEKGIGKARTTVYVIDPVKKYTNEEIKNIRNQAGMTQAVFANYMASCKPC